MNQVGCRLHLGHGCQQAQRRTRTSLWEQASHSATQLCGQESGKVSLKASMNQGCQGARGGCAKPASPPPLGLCTLGQGHTHRGRRARLSLRHGHTEASLSSRASLFMGGTAVGVNKPQLHVEDPKHNTAERKEGDFQGEASTEENLYPGWRGASQPCTSDRGGTDMEHGHRSTGARTEGQEARHGSSHRSQHFIPLKQFQQE